MSAGSHPLQADLVRRFPKLELHVHIEACINAEKIASLAAAFGVPTLRPTEQLFQYSSLAEFLTALEWWCDLFRIPEIAEEIAYSAAAQFKMEGIVYAEVLAGPRYWTHVGYQELIPALCAGFDRAQSDGYTDCRLIPSISREQSEEWAMELVEWLGTRRPERVVGLGLDGNESVSGRTSPKFEAVYKHAAELGFGRTAHSGESSGPDGVWDALNFLHVDRIDHGVRAIEDQALVDLLRERQVTLNVCPTSNIITGLYPRLSRHPIGRLIEAGVPVTVNTDDPLAMNVSLTGEFVDVGMTLGWTMTDVILATRRAIDAAFCGEKRAEQLRATVDAFVESSASHLA